MQQLNLPVYSFRIKSEKHRDFIFDEIRKKYVVLTPEEWVRQNFIKYLVKEKHFPCSLIAIETEIKINKVTLRCDIILYGKNGQPLVIVECKAPDVKITKKTFDQVIVYNLPFKAKYLVLTNGLSHFCCEPDYKTKTCKFLDGIPDYNSILFDTPRVSQRGQ
ncbi:MAG: type I restriction enzyme HsdR N-terminal domain-containing protein [Bacteroidia bacterium]|nr:type I restriction enzyme HsdR N-terminal domain-containing protein [Bacteroidia bacterium]